MPRPTPLLATLALLLAGCTFGPATPVEQQPLATPPALAAAPDPWNPASDALVLNFTAGQGAGALLVNVTAAAWGPASAYGTGLGVTLHGRVTGQGDDNWTVLLAYEVTPTGLEFLGGTNGNGERGLDFLTAFGCEARDFTMLLLVGNEQATGGTSIQLGWANGTPTAWSAAGPAASFAFYQEGFRSPPVVHAMGVDDTRQRLAAYAAYAGSLRLEAQVLDLPVPRFDYLAFSVPGGYVEGRGTYVATAPADAGPVQWTGNYSVVQETPWKSFTHQVGARQPMRQPATLEVLPTWDQGSNWQVRAGSLSIDLSGLGLPQEEPAAHVEAGATGDADRLVSSLDCF